MQSIETMITHQSCPICKNATQNVVLEDRGEVPTLQNTTLATANEAIAYPTGSLKILRCSNCSFVWNAAFDEAIIKYDDDYNNDVSTSDYYQNHLEKMADRILDSLPPGERLNYVEIGCGEGDFMRLVTARAGSRCASATGFDPSFTNPDGLPDGAVVHKHFFTPDRLDLIPKNTNVICSRHTIEHVADVQTFASSLCAPVTRSGISLFVETPDANWILENTAFQDFFYEHCSLYTPASIAHLFAQQGLSAEVSSVYGGQYMWVEATRPVTGPQKAGASGDDTLASHYQHSRSRLFERYAKLIKDRKSAGPVAVWGAASKGVTFSLLFAKNPDTAIDCAIDLNPAKQGRYLPVTAMPVVSPQDAVNRGVETVIIMNPNYENEIRKMARELGWSPEFHVLNG